MADPLHPVVLLHGVGLDASTLTGVEALLAGTGRRTLVHDRPGYRSAAALGPQPLDRQVDHLVAALEAFEPGVVDLVGISGGATLGLALALAHPHRLGRIVLHEPLVGSLAAGLHQQITGAARVLAGAPDPDGVATFLRGLVGAETWSEHTDLMTAAVAANADLVIAEVPLFATFDPTEAELAALEPLDLIVTVGGRRVAPARLEAAAVLEQLGGAAVVTLMRSGHLAQIDDPEGLVDVVVNGVHTTRGTT